jgi:hypothetical protein
MMYRRRDSLGSGEARTDVLEMSALSSSNAFYILFVQWKESNFFNNLYRGSPHSPSGDLKRLRAVRHPMSH